MCQSVRGARPQDASRALDRLSSWSGFARLYPDTFKQRMLRPVSQVADMEARLGPAGRYVNPVFQYSRRHYVGSIRDMEEAGSQVGLFSFPLPRRLVLRGSSSMRVPATGIF